MKTTWAIRAKSSFADAGADDGVDGVDIEATLGLCVCVRESVCGWVGASRDSGWCSRRNGVLDHIRNVLTQMGN